MENFKSVFSESYHAIYCCAKGIMNKEEDVLALMKEVYLLVAESTVADFNAKSWLIKQTYILGCGKLRKKKAREAEIIELQEHEYDVQKGIDCEKTKKIICETFAELPDLYYATLFALYYNQYSVKDVAAVTGYSEGVVINRLNYIHKYLSKKLDDYHEEHKMKVQFSVEMVYEALKQWVAENTMDETVVQNLYTNLCLELKLPVETIFEEEILADENVAPVVIEKNDIASVKEELQAHSVKTGLDKKQVALVGAIIGGLAILVFIAILLIGNSDKKNEKKDNQPAAENQVDEEDQTVLDDAADESQDEVSEDKSEGVLDSEYILPTSNSEKLTKSDLQGLSPEELRLARNEIFARHGMIFGAADLDAYFREKSWYKPTIAYDEFYEVVEMNSYEEANLSLILEVEAELE